MTKQVVQIRAIITVLNGHYLTLHASEKQLLTILRCWTSSVRITLDMKWCAPVGVILRGLYTMRLDHASSGLDYLSSAT